MRKIIQLLLIVTIVYPSILMAKGQVNQEWQQAVINAVAAFPEKGGYYTGRKSTPDFPKSAWRGLNEAFNMQMADMKPNFLPQKAQPSFCSLATYAVLIKALADWDTNTTLSREAWLCLKPYVGVTDNINIIGFNQSDGEGCWGRANANGPGLAVLINELKVGYNFTAFRGAKTDALKETATETYQSDDEWRNNKIWDEAEPGDFMKIFWNRNESSNSDSGAVIGVNGNKSDEQEHGHSVIFMGYTPDGLVKYWSSNGPGSDPKNAGYGIATCDKTKIQRVVFTRITNPANFENAKKIRYNNKHKWLSALDGKAHGTTAELKKNCGIK